MYLHDDHSSICHYYKPHCLPYTNHVILNPTTINPTVNPFLTTSFSTIDRIPSITRCLSSMTFTPVPRLYKATKEGLTTPIDSTSTRTGQLTSPTLRMY